MELICNQIMVSYNDLIFQKEIQPEPENVDFDKLMQDLKNGSGLETIVQHNLS